MFYCIEVGILINYAQLIGGIMENDNIIFVKICLTLDFSQNR